VNPYTINTPFEGDFMRMADQFQGAVIKDSVQELQLRSLYNVGGMQFVIPELPMKGTNGIVAVPEDEKTPETKDALTVQISSGGETKQMTIIGTKGMASFSQKQTIGGLDFTLGYGSKVYELPFSVKLNDFIAQKYPGTEKGYASFMSKVTVEDERPFDYDIFMNHVLDHGGYRFFQSSFHPDEKGTVLSVSHDFWGTWITYIGYFLLYIGLMGILFFGNTRFKDLSRSIEKVKAKKALLSLVFLFGSITASLAQQADAASEDSHAHSNTPLTDLQIALEKTTVSPAHAVKFGALVIQDDGGRMKPINTFASELLRKLSFKTKYEGLNPDQVLLSMMLNPALWYNTPFIALDKKGQNDSLRNILGLPSGQRMVKATDFFDASGAYKLAPFLQDAYATTNPNKFQKDFQDIDLRLGLLNRALGGEIIKIFPLLNDENNKWISAVAFRSGKHVIGDSLYANFVKNAVPFYLMSLEKAIVTGDYSSADKLLDAFTQNQNNHGSEVMPAPEKIQAEIFYNQLDIFNKLYRYYALIGVVMFFFLVFQIFKDRRFLRYGIFGFKGIVWLLFAAHTAGLVIRWYISGHAPWSDAYESILYVSWATLAMGIALGRKSDLTLAATTFVTAMLLWIAHQSWVDPAVANLVPVLDSYWLMIHVAVIVGSYGPLTVGMILGIVSLILMIMSNEKNKKRMDLNLKELTIINELALTVGLIMLTIGNFLGGQWANESWGRYWGWDPKETWALISILIYAFVIHTRLVPGLRNRWTFNFLSVVAYASIMMTYFGVNFYLVGLHSYASGAQVITPSFIWYCVIGVILLGGFSYWKHHKVFKK
jgi:cytochrome c-type biogenesis protein CcsB